MNSHFSLEELLASGTASRLGINNYPDQAAMRNILLHLIPGLEKVRVILKAPMRINSGFRSPALNARIPGSSATSAHTLGYAADFVCPTFGTPWEVCNRLAGTLRVELDFDQIIYEYGAWIHISFDLRYRRLLTTKLAGQPYRSGLYKE